MSPTSQSGHLESAILADGTITDRDARKVTVSALVGTAMEWYDFFLFGAAAALVFNVQYFANEDPIVAALASFATFGIGLLARPLGGFFFGALGDRVGRRNVLISTIVGIGIVTGVIGLLPNFAAIGLWAPVMLVILRFLQGLFVGGEWSGAMTMVVEHAPVRNRALYAAMPQIGSPIGNILSSGGFFLFTVFLSKDSFDAWGWRVPFVIAIPLLLVALWIRSKMAESPVFKAMEAEGHVEEAPVRALFRHNWAHVLVGAAAAFLGVGGFYLVTTFVQWYGTKILGYESWVLLLGTMIAAFVEIFVLIAAGYLGRAIGASKVIFWGGVASALVAFPAFLLIVSGDLVLIILGMTLAVAALSVPYGASGTVLTGLFPARMRYTGVGAAQNLAGMVSGLVPLGATAFTASANNDFWPAALMLVAFSVLTALAGLLAPRMSVDIPDFKH